MLKKRQKPRKNQWNETDLDSYIYSRREKYGNSRPQKKRSGKTDVGGLSRKTLKVFIKPHRPAHIPSKPNLPPNRHTPDKVITWIPYSHLHCHQTHNTSRIPLPAQRTPFIKRKQHAKRRIGGGQTGKLTEGRKGYLLLFYVNIAVLQFSREMIFNCIGPGTASNAAIRVFKIYGDFGQKLNVSLLLLLSQKKLFC